MSLREHVPLIKPDSPRVIKHTPQPKPIPPERGNMEPIRTPPIVIPTKILKKDLPDGRRWTRPGPVPEPR